MENTFLTVLCTAGLVVLVPTIVWLVTRAIFDKYRPFKNL